MQGGTPQTPNTQEVKPEVKDVGQAPQQPPTVPQVPSPPAGGSTPPPKPKEELKTKKIVIGLVLTFVLTIVTYGIFIAITYLNCSKTTPKTCETNKCSFSLSGFKSTSEINEDCCGNTKCEVGETYSDCDVDCPSCGDGSDCTKDSYDYDKQACVYEQIYAPCYTRPITLAPAIPGNDYQIKIELASANFDYSKAKASGEDLRFADENNTPLSFWIEEWNPGGESSVWVKIPDSEINKIYMYYGNTDAGLAGDAVSVFDFFEGFDYESEKELLKAWNKHGKPTIELSDGVVTISTSGGEEHGGQYISQNVGADILLNNLFEMSVKRFSGEGTNHMANIGYDSPTGGSIGDGNAWLVLRYNPSPDGGTVVFGGNNGGVASPPMGNFSTIQVIHRDGVSTAYEPPSNKVAEYSWPIPVPRGDYVLLGGQTYKSGSGKASYDWIRVRKYASKEPSATVGDEESVSEGSVIKELY